MAWCPITSLDYADEAYEWNMGQYSTSGTRATSTWTSALSSDMAKVYADYSNDYASDLKYTDAEGTSMSDRVNMYNPMYYLANYYKGYQTSTPAAYWRIRTGINQGDTALTVETNLALALQRYDGVKSVDFATVWNKAHTMAERTGTASANFIDWVNGCLKEN